MDSTDALRLVTFYHDPNRETNDRRGNPQGDRQRFRSDVFPLLGFDEEARLAVGGSERLVEVVSEFEDTSPLFCCYGDASMCTPEAELGAGAE